jgi:tetratricopeptide (TPR) repeat protein/regulation of enolase protein 1 (concanavalin A-like superfamily)
MPPKLIVDRYYLQEPIGYGSMGSVFLAIDRLKNQTVALKRLSIFDNYDNIAEAHKDLKRRAIISEFQTLAALHHPNIITVLDFGFEEQGQPFFTMEFLPDAQEFVTACEQKTIEVKIDYLVQLGQALAYLHRQGLLHRDLKSENVLVANNRIRVLDFGLSTSSGVTKDRSGTLAYMAPEVFRTGEVTESADLYAWGVLAFKVFAGQFPFDARDISGIIANPPNLSLLPVNSKLQEIIGSLLAKTPEDRPRDAQNAITKLCTAIEIHPPRKDTIRESFLQAASFVGRESELQKLTAALDQSLENKGSLWFVAGESGVGKSRLISELRTQALVKGARVTIGQGISEGQSPYRIWQEPLRQLILMANINQEEASLLKAILPNIDSLLTKAIADPPRYNPKVFQALLFQSLRKLFNRQTKPVMIVLEDLHWAGSESLALLKRIAQIVTKLPILILASLRTLALTIPVNELQNVHTIHLDRLNAQDTATLCAAMLGTSGQQPEIVEYLHKETEGNPFFLVEVVRELAQTSGNLENIGESSLPQNIMTGGVQAFVQRRLSRLPLATMPGLQWAATAGRELDTELISSSFGDGFDEWLSTCSATGVLEFQGTRWRFSHDKIREGVLATISATRRPEIYKDVAQEIENCYPHDPNQYAHLAYLWEQNGNLETAIDYHVRAGEHFRRSYANTETIDHFKSALTHLKSNPKLRKHHWDWQFQALSGLGKVSYEIGQISTAYEVLQEAVELGQKKGVPIPDLINIFHWLGEVQFWLGKHNERLDLGLRGLTLSSSKNESLETALMNQLVAFGYYFVEDDKAKWRTFTLRTASFIRRLTYVEELRPAYVHIYLVHRFYRNLGEGIKWLKYLEDQAKQCQDLVALAEVDHYTAMSYYHLGNFTAALQRFEQGLESSRKIEDRKRENWIIQSIGKINFNIQGDFEATRSAIHRFLATAAEFGFNDESVAEEFGQLGLLELCHKNYGAAIRAFHEANRISQECGYRFPLLWSTYLLGRVYLAQKNRSAARESFTTALELATSGDFSSESYINYAPGIDMLILVSALETVYDDQSGFHSFCDAYQKNHPEIKPDPSFWAAQTANPRPPKMPILHNEIFSGSLLPGWDWADKFNDSSLTIQSELLIRTPNGREVWNHNHSAPRLMRETFGDFVVQTICYPAQLLQPAIGGLILWMDDQNYLWLERGRPGDMEVIFGGCSHGKDTVLGRGRLPYSIIAGKVSKEITLRLCRSGEQVQTFCSSDGVDWFTIGKAIFPTEYPIQVGIYASGVIPRHVYHGDFPQGTAIKFKSFSLWGNGSVSDLPE